MHGCGTIAEKMWRGRNVLIHDDIHHNEFAGILKPK